MKIVCFPNYTCGAILCDVLNLENSKIGLHNNFENLSHNRGKITPVNHYDGTNYNEQDLYDRVRKLDKWSSLRTKWIGTHCWPGLFDNNVFEHVINITTSTKLSRMYRYARIFYTMIAGIFPNQIKPAKPKTLIYYNTGFSPVYEPNITNIEFEDWVNLTCEAEQTILKLTGTNDNRHLHARRKAWMQVNDFLYDKRFDYIVKEWEKVHN